MDINYALLGTAAAIGFFHTLLGPDHYIPFVAMARVGNWGLRKTLWVTLLCGLGHVGSSILLGTLGVAFSMMLFRLENIEEVRGDLASWLLLGFGVIYSVWGVMQAIRNVPHAHLHAHPDGTVHEHLHQHHAEHLHVHQTDGRTDDRPVDQGKFGGYTPWVLFTIFLFGPCEPLIPMLMYPAAEQNLGLVALVATVFGVVTLVTMTSMVVLMNWGVSWLSHHAWHRFGHAAAGLSITACGLAVKLGL